VERPKRVFGLFDREKLSLFFLNIRNTVKYGDHWSEGTSGLRWRVYRKYEDYIKHQSSKLSSANLTSYDTKYRKVLRERLEKASYLRRGMSVLCLAARLGTEVKAFLDIGCFTIGIDINPGEGNRYVVWGDFHDIQYPTESVDVVFTNSIDHVFDIQKLIHEIRRVLKSHGLLVVEALAGYSEGTKVGGWESFCWSKIDDLVSLFERSQFSLVQRASFDCPWVGQHLCFKKINSKKY
jgi:SAM-dependent methyltransferase